MPVYEYECKQCGKRHEIMQRLADAPLMVCSDCAGEVYRVLSPSGLSFKGEGWYITDYARKGQDKGETPPADGKKDAQKDTKTDVKSDTPAPTATGEKKEAAPSTPSPPPPPNPSGPPKDKKS
jgi:putative FmdB family regulatory protein